MTENLNHTPDAKDANTILDTEKFQLRGVVFLDLDGCVVEKWRSTHTSLQLEGLEMAHRRIARLRKDGIVTIVNTGRGVDSTELAELLGVDTVLCENGAVLIENGNKELLLPDSLKAVVSLLKDEIEPDLETNARELWEGLELYKKHSMVTILIPDRDRGNQAKVEEYVSKVKERLSQNSQFSQMLAKDLARIQVSGNAIDIIPNWGKEQGMRTLIERNNWNVPIASIDDSVVDAMNAATYWMAPSDAKQGLKENMSNHNEKNPGTSYTAFRSFIYGTLECLRQFHKMIKQGENILPDPNTFDDPRSDKFKARYKNELIKSGLLKS